MGMIVSRNAKSKVIQKEDVEYFYFVWYIHSVVVVTLALEDLTVLQIVKKTLSGPAVCNPVTVCLINVTGILVNVKEQITVVTLDGLENFVKNV